MGCGGSRWMRIPWDISGCGYPNPGYPHPPMYPQNDDRPERRTGGDDEVVPDELKKLYARGEITREQYREALERLEQGAFTLTDLWELRRPKELEKSAAKSHGSAPAALKQKWEQVSKAEEEIHSTIKASTR